jgi:hypothetical protein
MRARCGGFADSVAHGTVIKALASNTLYEDGQRKVGHTHKLTDDDLAELGGLELTAHQFQEWVPKLHEVRLIAVGRDLFAVGIHTTDPAALTDWRANYGGQYGWLTPTLGTSISDAIAGLLAQGDTQ